MTFGAALGGVAAEWLGAHIQDDINDENTRDANEFSRDMASTQYSRAAHDLQSAGLNRVLALGNPAAAPTGAQHSVSQPKLAQSGIMAASARSQIELNESMEKLNVQKAVESESAEALNRVAALTSATQGS